MQLQEVSEVVSAGGFRAWVHARDRLVVRLLAQPGMLFPEDTKLTFLFQGYTPDLRRIDSLALACELKVVQERLIATPLALHFPTKILNENELPLIQEAVL
jgi:hypothetical protein